MTRSIKPTDDDLTEVTWMDTPRVDLVRKAANGHDFILAKSAADEPSNPSLFTPEDVRDLAKNAQEGNVTDSQPTEALAKDAAGDVEDLLEAPDVDNSGDPDDPTSAAWEATDAARAQQAIELTVALKRLVTAAADREATEAVISGDFADGDNVWDLQDVLGQLDCILGVLAPFAVNEQAEADERDADIDGSLVLKSGRTLSGANESNIRQAQELLTNVLNTLPAPVEDVAKTEAEEAPVTDTIAKTEDTAVEPVQKADSEAVLIYDANGNVLGSVKATQITTFAATPSAAAADAGTDAKPDDGTTPADPTTDPQVDSSTEPADATVADDGTVIPGTNTVQSPAPADDDTVKKSLEDIVKSSLEELLAPLAEKVAATGDVAELVKGLQEQVKTMGRTPDDRRSPLLNGSSGIAGAPVRGNEGQLETLQKAVETAQTPEALHDAQQQLAFQTIRARFA